MTTESSQARFMARAPRAAAMWIAGAWLSGTTRPNLSSMIHAGARRARAASFI